IMESLVKKKQKGVILELKRRHLKKVSKCINTPYPTRKIRRICASSSLERVLINSRSGGFSDTINTRLKYEFQCAKTYSLCNILLKLNFSSQEKQPRSIKYPRGIAENVLIKVDKFVLPIDFVILDMREDTRILIILGRPFLATARAMINVFNKRITLRVGDEEVIFDVDQSIKKPLTDDDECYGIDDLDQTIHLEAQELMETTIFDSHPPPPFSLYDLDIDEADSEG
ncbi:hypothetical protein Tco_0845317, partial [Tanacetum coccineum]